MTRQHKAIFSACASSLMGMCSFVTTAVLAYIFGAYHNVPAASVILILTITPLVGIFTSFLIGPISMRISKKSLLEFALTAEIIAGIIFFFFGGRAPYTVMLIAGALCGLVSGTMATIPNAVITDNSTPEERGRFCGYASSSMMAGALIMSLAGGALGTIKWQYAYSLYFLAVPVLLIVIFMLPKDTPVKREKTQASLNTGENGKIPAIVIVMCIHYALMFVCLYTYSINISSYVISEYKLGSSLHAGIAASLSTLSGVFAGIIFGKFSKLFKKWVIPVSCIFITAGLAITTFITSALAGCLIGGILIGFTKSSIAPYAISRVTVKVPGHLTSLSISLLMGCMNLGMFLSVYIVRFFTEFAGGDTIFNKFLISTILGAAAIIFAIIIYVICDKKMVPEKAGGTAH